MGAYKNWSVQFCVTTCVCSLTNCVSTSSIQSGTYNVESKDSFQHMTSEAYKIHYEDDITQQMIEFHKGTYDKYVSSDKFKIPNKFIVDKFMSGSAPYNLKINKEEKSFDFDFRKITFCRGDKEDYFAELYNQSGIEAKKAMISLYSSCLISVESLGYVSEGRMKKFWHEIWVNSDEKGSGTVGFGQLDKNPQEGDQYLCRKTFKQWGMDEPRSGSGKDPALAPDQFYNVACTTYLSMGNWINSYKQNNEKCATVVPSKKVGMTTSDVEHGPILFRNPAFIGCLKRATNPQVISLISNSMGYNLDGLDESRLLAIAHQN